MQNTSPPIAEVEVVQPTAIESIQRAEVDMQIAAARRYPPRNLQAVKRSMLDFATLDVETAESCFYTVPRGDKNIQGPSVRLAEIALSQYGNLRAGSRVVSVVTTGDNPHVVIQSACHDLEKNVCVNIEKRRRITSKKNRDGTRRPVDEDDINLAVNACSSIALRDAIFKVIPGALIKPVYEQAKAVAIGDAKTLSDRRARAIESFAKMGVQLPRVLALLEKKTVEEIGLSELETLTGLRNAIKDGEISIDDAFKKEAASPLPTFQKPADKKPAPAAPEPPKQEAAPANQQHRKRLDDILASENANFDTLLFVCTDQKDGFTNWAHHVSDHDSLDAIPDESVEFFVDKEKQLRMFLKSAVGLGKGIQTA